MSTRPAAGSPNASLTAMTAATAPAPTGSPLASAPNELELPEGELKAARDAPLGGQAVLEGVMMRGVSNWAVAVRKPTEEQLAEGELSPVQAALGEFGGRGFPLK